MQILKLLVALFTAPLASGYVVIGQAIFYYDDNCKDYAGIVFPHPTQTSDYPLENALGGPYGSKSMMWVSGEVADNCLGPHFFACKNAECSAGDVVAQWECKSFRNGVWAAYQEECPEAYSTA